MSGTLIEKTTYDLGLVIAANMATCGLPLEAQEYYLQNKNLIPEAIRRGFVLPVPEVQPAPTIVVQRMFKTADTDFNFWLDKCQEFAKKFLGMEVNLSEMFNIPEELPWKSAIPVFDPGGLTNRDAVERALKAQELAVWEEVDVMRYSGSQAGDKPSLFLIQNLDGPDEDTLDLTPDRLRESGKSWLSQRGYALAFALHHFVMGEYLDPQTWTWFPANRLSSGEVEYGGWHPDDREVSFGWLYAGGHFPHVGARLAIPVSLRS